MENASKALLIAGAILIAILLIAIGMMVFNSANSVIDTAASGMSDNEKTMHNKKFNMYAGTRTGTEVKELAKLVREHNANPENYRINTLVVYTSESASSWSWGGRDNFPTQNLEYGIEQIINGTTSSTSNELCVKPLQQYKVVCNDKSQVSDIEDGLISEIKIYKK